tara:strand:+ start:3926 stop:4273 length:348 start_codon:yes stop_codon:yes gene_type:complete
MPSRKEIEQHYQRYMRRVTENMRDLRRQGRDISTPVTRLQDASPERLRTRARFGQRKAVEVLNRNQPLKDARGYPTPAAMQFRRWSYPLPKTKMDVRKILSGARKYLQTGAGQNG